MIIGTRDAEGYVIVVRDYRTYTIVNGGGYFSNEECADVLRVFNSSIILGGKISWDDGSNIKVIIHNRTLWEEVVPRNFYYLTNKNSLQPCFEDIERVSSELMNRLIHQWVKYGYFGDGYLDDLMRNHNKYRNEYAIREIIE